MSILQEKIEKGLSYPDYHQMVETMFAEGRTSGENQSEEFMQYTEMNLQRMNRLLKTIKIDNELKALVQQIDRPLYFLCLAEAWCGDVAQNLPIIHLILQSNPLCQMRIVWRDENLDLMNLYLTNGGRSIPKVVVIDEAQFQELAVWGPRPAVVQAMMLEYKKDNKGVAFSDFVKGVQLWYAKDKGQSLQAEWKKILKDLIA